MSETVVPTKPVVVRPRPRRRWRVVAVRGLAAAGLLGLSAWNLTRSPALGEAAGAFERRDYRNAVRLSLDHLTHRPWSREAASLAARGLTRMNFPALAEPYYAQAGPIAPDDLETRGHVLLLAGDFARSADVYEQLLAVRPEDPVALRRLSAARLGQMDDPRVLALADRLDRVKGGAVLAATLRGVVNHERKRSPDAVAAFERVLALDPGLEQMPLPKSLFWSHLAEDLAASGRVADARAYLEKAAVDNPDARTLCLLGRALQFAGEVEPAEGYFRRSADLDARYDLPRLYLGQIALQRGEAEKARELLLEALALSPRRYETVYALSLACGRLGREDEARHWQARARQLRGEAAGKP